MFWSNFWPGFAATVLGAAFGVPVGLWLNRRAERSVAATRASEERTLTSEALEQLEPIIRRHGTWFPILGAWGNLNEYFEGPLVESWMVLRSQIVASHLMDRHLFADLAAHFERCVRLDELVRLRSSLSLAGPPAQQSRVQVDQDAIVTRLNNMKNATSANPVNLADRVAAEIRALSAPTKGRPVRNASGPQRK